MLELESRPSRFLEPFLRRGDFSRWIADVFGDRALAAELRALEERHRGASRDEVVPEIIGAIRARYDLFEDELAPTDRAQDAPVARDASVAHCERE